MIAKGSTVRQKVPTIEGTVDNAVLDPDTGLISYHVQYKDAEGHPSARWFNETELEVTNDGKVVETPSATAGETK